MGFEVAKRPAIALVLAAAFAVFAASQAGAQGPRGKDDKPAQSLGDMLFPSKPNPGAAIPPPVARYVAETGEAFILDRSTARPMLRFEGSNEIWVLQPVVGSRGDTLYKTDVGRVLLRDTKVGGLTIFTPKRSEGAAAAMSGASGPLRITPVSPNALATRLLVASSIVSRAARRQVPFHAEATLASSALIADAALVTTDALVRLSSSPEGRAQLDRIQKVFITYGPRPGVALREGILIVVVAPHLGLAGRPSSERVAYAALK